MNEFLEFKIYVPNLYRNANFVCEEGWRISDLVDRVAKEFQFPKEAQATCTYENTTYNLQTYVKDVPSQQLKMHFTLKTQILFEHSKIKKEIQANALGNAAELQETLQTQLPLLPYRVRIIDNIECQKWRSRIEGKVNYQIIAQFFIFYQNSQTAFEVDAFNSFEIIKQQINQQLNIKYPFNLYYNDQKLEDKDLYYQYQIPDNACLKLIVKNRFSLIFKAENVSKRIEVSPQESIENLQKYISKLFSINQNFCLFYQTQILNPNLKLRQTRPFQDDDEILIKFINEQPKHFKLYLESDDKCFTVFVKPNEKVRILDQLLEDSTFFFFETQLDINKTFQDQLPSIEEIHLSIKQKMKEIIFQHKIFVNKKQTVQVYPNEIIESHVRKILQQDEYELQNEKILVYYDNKEIDPKQSFQDLRVNYKLGISYCREMAKVKFSDSDAAIHYFDMSLNILGKDLTKFIIDKFNIIDCRLCYKGKDIDPYTKLIQYYDPHEPIPLKDVVRIPDIIAKVFLQTFELEIHEPLRPTASVGDLREKIKAQFGIPNADCILVKFENKFINDQVKIESLDYVNNWFYVEIEEKIQLFFKNPKGTILHQDIFSSLAIVKQELEYFCQPSKVICTFNGKRIDLSLTFVELGIQDNDVIIVEEIQTQLVQVTFQRKGDLNIVSKQCEMQMTLKDAMLQITEKKVICFVKGIEVDQQQPLFNIGIKDIIEYDLALQITFTKQGTLLCTKTLLSRSPAKDAMISEVVLSFCMFYQGKIIQPNKTWEALGIDSDCTIQIENVDQTIVVQDELQTLKINAKITSTVKQLRNMLQLNDQNKLFYYQDKQLSDDTVMYALTGTKSEIVLECKEKVEIEDSLHLPVSLELPLKIRFVDENGKIFEEEVKPSMKIEDFIKLFQQREGKQILTLFYEGEEMDKSQTFEQQCISNGAEIEIQY